MITNKQQLQQEFLKNLQKRLGTFTTEVLSHPTPEECEKAFIEWGKKNPQAFEPKVSKF